MAFSKVLTVVGEPSRNMIIAYIQKKYGISVFSNPGRHISLQEIEDTIPEILPIGAELVIRILKAELERLEENGD